MAIVVLTMFSATFANNAISPIYVIYQQRFHFSALTLTAIFATYALAVLVALLCVGRISDDIGRKSSLLAGSILLVTSTIIFLTAASTVALLSAAPSLDSRPERSHLRAQLRSSSLNQTTIGASQP